MSPEFSFSPVNGLSLFLPNNVNAAMHKRQGSHLIGSCWVKEGSSPAADKAIELNLNPFIMLGNPKNGVVSTKNNASVGVVKPQPRIRVVTVAERLLGVSLAVLFAHILYMFAQPIKVLLLLNGCLCLRDRLTTHVPAKQTAIWSFWATAAFAYFCSLGPEGICAGQTGTFCRL
jgi:hypothetical protein